MTKGEFSREALISGEGWMKNLGKMGNNRDIYCYANREVVNFEIEYFLVLGGCSVLWGKNLLLFEPTVLSCIPPPYSNSKR